MVLKQNEADELALELFEISGALQYAAVRFLRSPNQIPDILDILTIKKVKYKFDNAWAKMVADMQD